MSELSINIHIAGRAYPLTVKPEQEEEVRAAGKLIQEKLNLYLAQFNLKDQRDALSMLALELATENLHLKQRLQEGEEKLAENLNSLEEMLSQVPL